MNAKVWVGLQREEGSYGKIPLTIASKASSERRKNGEGVRESMTAAESTKRKVLIVSSDQVAAVTNVGINIASIPKIGIMATAVSTIVSYCILAVYSDGLGKESHWLQDGF